MENWFYSNFFLSSKLSTGFFLNFSFLALLDFANFQTLYSSEFWVDWLQIWTKRLGLVSRIRKYKKQNFIFCDLSYGFADRITMPKNDLFTRFLHLKYFKRSRAQTLRFFTCPFGAFASNLPQNNWIRKFLKIRSLLPRKHHVEVARASRPTDLNWQIQKPVETLTITMLKT